MEISDITVAVFVLGSGGGDAIPYAYYFLIFTVIGTIALVYLEKRKTK